MWILLVISDRLKYLKRNWSKIIKKLNFVIILF